MRIQKLLLITFLIVANAKGQTQDTPAQEPNLYELPDLIVTGTLWDTPLKDVAESVTVFSEGAIQDRQANHLQDLVMAIPNLTATGGNNRSRYFQLRGMGENSQFEGETPDLSVRFLIDDFDFTGIAGIASLFDVSQLEVIRGSHSSAYGVNASAGIIKLSTNEANGEEVSKAKISVGTHNQRSFGYATGGVLGDKASSKTCYRLSISQNKTDGFIENTDLNRKDTNQSEETFSLLKLKHKPSNNSTVQTSFVYADAKAGYDQWSLYNTYLKTQSDDPGEDNQRSKGISVHINSKNFNNFSVTSVSTILNTNSIYSYDSDWGNFEFDTSGYDGFLSIQRNRKSLSQEIRMDSSEDSSLNTLFSKWTAGIYLSKLSEESNINYLDNFEDDGGAEVFSDYTAKSLSIFSKVQNNLNHLSKLSLSFRYEYQMLDFMSDIRNNAVYWGSPSLDSATDITNNDHLFGTSVSYENNLTKNYTLFISYNDGYKSAGVNSSSFRSRANISPLTFDTERFNTYEIGLAFFNPQSNYQAKLNIFYLNRFNTQLRDAGGSKGFFNYFTSNQGYSKGYGIEYQSIWNFVKNWTLETNLSFLKAKRANSSKDLAYVPDYRLEETREDSSKDLANAPKYQYSFLFKYTPDNGFYSNISINGSDDYYEENGHDLKREAYTVVNATIGYAKDHWDISLWAKNLLDNDYTQRVFYFDNYHPEDNYANDSKRLYKASGDPLNYGVTINYNW